jgi:hypothetical protein
MKTRVKHIRAYNESISNWGKMDKHYVVVQLCRYFRLFGKKVSYSSSAILIDKERSILIQELDFHVRFLFAFSDESTKFLVDYFGDSEYLIIELAEAPAVNKMELILKYEDSMKFVNDLIEIQKSEQLKIYIAGNKFGI